MITSAVVAGLESWATNAVRPAIQDRLCAAKEPSMWDATKESTVMGTGSHRSDTCVTY